MMMMTMINDGGGGGGDCGCAGKDWSCSHAFAAAATSIPRREELKNFLLAMQPGASSEADCFSVVSIIAASQT